MSRITQLNRMPFVAFLATALLGLIVPAALPQALTADQIVEKNVAARGGLKAWREIQTMTLSGKIDAGTNKNVQLPFVLKLKRPQMSRLEIDFAGKKALQIYDGKNGWKVRPFLGRNEVEPFTTTEMHTAADQGELDGYLIDHEAKGIKVEVMGTDSVEGHDAYRLQLTMKDGQVRHLWVDATSFLEVKVEGTPRRLDGKMNNVEIYYRNYGSISGLMIPFVLETAVEKVQPTRKLTVETVVLNPKLEDNAFAKPDLPGMNLISPVQQSTVQPNNAAAKEVSGGKVR